MNSLVRFAAKCALMFLCMLPGWLLAIALATLWHALTGLLLDVSYGAGGFTMALFCVVERHLFPAPPPTTPTPEEE